MTTDSTYDAIIIGGGIAGLTAAAYLGRTGRRALVLERSARLGGRAITQEKQGFHLNIGPHALYAKGAGCRILGDLGVSYTGGQPTDPHRWILDGETAAPMPGSAFGILTTGFLTIRERIDVLRVLACLSSYANDPKWQHRPIGEWLAAEFRQPRSRDFVGMYIRLATYCASPEQNAAAALRQLAIALQGVWYLDGGWQTLVDGLAKTAARHGVVVETSASVAAVAADAHTVMVRTGDDRIFEARTAILATSPQLAAKLVNGGSVESLSAWAQAARPVQAACLDVGLSSLPNPRATFALGFQEPYYLSVHTPTARLAPEGGAVIHVARYLGENDPPDLEARLEALLDRFQPGWRERVVTQRFLPRMSVTEARWGSEDRPGPDVPGLPRVFVAGDWVGGEGMLVDAALSSAREAAELANRALSESPLTLA